MRKVDLACTSDQRRFLHHWLYDDDVHHILFGGARGPGKTFTASLGMVLRRLQFPRTKGVCIRKTERAAVSNIRDEVDKACYMLGIDRTYLEQKAMFRLPFGSTIQLAHCGRESDYEKYIGLQFTDIWWEEAVQHTRSARQKVNASNRTDYRGDRHCTPKCVYTTNPGGIGHQDLYEDFIDEDTRKPNHVFIPALLKDALATLEADPGYRDRTLKGLPAWKRQQWEEGNWLAMAGVYFELYPWTFVEQKVPYYADWYAGVDYGSNAPFVVLWAAKWQDSQGVDHIHFVKEIYERNRFIDDQATEAMAMERVLRDQYRITRDITYFGDPSIAYPKPSESSDTDYTIKQVWNKHGWTVVPSMKKVRVPGWHLIRMLMKDRVMTVSPEGCPSFIKEFRGAVYENPEAPSSEDISQDCADHALTASSYLLRKVFLGGYNGTPIDPYAKKATVAT